MMLKLRSFHWKAKSFLNKSLQNISGKSNDRRVCQQVIDVLSRKTHINKQTDLLPLFSFAVAISIIVLSSVADKNVECDRESFSINEIASMLKEQLKVARGKLQKAGKEVPLITVRTLKFPEREKDTQVLDIRVPPDCNIHGLVSAWVDVFGDTGEMKRSHLDKLKLFYGDKSQFNLPLVSADKNKSMTITKYGTGSETNISISLFKDNGYDEKDIKYISKGYQDGLCQKTFPRIEFKFDQSSTPKSFNHLIDPLKKFFPSNEDDSEDGSFFMKSITDNDSSDTFSSKEKKSSQSSAVSKLESLGVEVFDAANQPHLTWDALAGYEHVKKDIEDTVLNALKYPDVYDQIAQRTRVIFESNRPKAILLEGPPGTGKTLSARILASQCESTLVILRLESIVSKWYGDSEKKLSKILDACDELPSAIIFVDEIDALAQSRESEYGIHEVSKRVLSVLLQRLEGFHGKSKSILICATNRKQDLDPALLSRFDLIIPFALPDFSTRVEIFQRYAKQFQNMNNKEIYSELAQLSQGLSCRDIKEACEQAERKCASRIVKHFQQQDDGKITNKKATAAGNKSSWLPSILSGGGNDGNDGDNYKKTTLTPTPEDYKDCLQAKITDARSRGNNGPLEPYSSV